MKKFSAVFVFFLIATLQLNAVGPYIDPTRAATLAICSKKAKKALEAQNTIQGMNTAGHIWLELEVNEVVKFQKEFNEYLDAFGDVLTMTAEIYGLYYEVSKTIKGINDLEKTLSRSPANALAVAFSTRRNAVYRRIIENGIDIVMDIKTLISKKAKKTEADKVKLLMGIRPKLHVMNKTLTVLNLAIKYTAFADVWREITGRQQSYLTGKDKEQIAKQCIKDWKSNIGMR